MQNVTRDDLIKCLRRQDITDANIIGNARQPGDNFIDEHNTYTWYFAIGAAKRPQRILELGVRYGYALIAMGKGALEFNTPNLQLIGIDAEADGILSNGIAYKNIINEICSIQTHTVDKAAEPLCPHSIFRENTRNIDAVNASLRTIDGKYDIVHVDADHSPDGIRAELTIARDWIAADGWILIDDIDTQHVKDIADDFCRNYDIIPLHIPTFHGMYLCNMAYRKEI